MAGKMVAVGCKLPHGIRLHHPLDENKIVELQGKNKAIVIGADHAVTEVDSEFWEPWAASHKEYAPFKAGAIFVAKSAADVAAMAKDLKGVKTGFEGLNPKSHGVKPEKE